MRSHNGIAGLKDRQDAASSTSFKSKVERKSGNAVGIFVRVNNFSSDALAQFAAASPFVVFTGEDIYMALENHIRLDELLRAKKHYVDETGDCYLPARNLLT